ncbi:putative lipoprotein [Cupriavidus taiwanensis]|uniref:Lipoprotein n=1 Tax=Cupriavidus taiwanensis TaxID=164546 RepID=A0A976AY50_9BURK|nr:hypothetical protein [Cupriavidus taiwanensis]SOZ59804.1 putative lipoprotein [Cupriavidus taiwanensis]SOZ60045.1 putative lipoprotein [Cupriavidus taiwanensis]SOZ63700.1 putative lipoprotein [Cupriavidus taiwanensis]SOZ99508.1 putative lipoprotein [Cupriavidus taiwanensis]SPA06501.1 putative lipoprotein [Cupriavidus taiwanensis]
MRPVPPPPSPAAVPRWSLTCCAALLALALCACSPRYDWRTIQSGEGGYAALYPGKPTSAARDVTIAGRKLPMTMEAARIDDTLFAVGVVTLPADDEALRREALAAMQAGLLANLGTLSGEPRTRPVTIMSADRPGRPLAGLELQASGVSPQDQSPRRLSARLVAVGTRAFQAVVLESGEAARDARQAEQVEQFLGGFHPL